MAQSTSTFHCSVITPEAVVLDVEVSDASFPAHDGEFGILRDRAPLVCKLGIGALRVETADGPQRLYLDGGFAEIHENRLTILTNRAQRPDQIDADRVRAELDEARTMRITDPAAGEARAAAIARARAQLRLVEGRSA